MIMSISCAKCVKICVLNVKNCLISEQMFWKKYTIKREFAADNMQYPISQ